MRIIDYLKSYGDGHSIRYELRASNAPFVYIDGQPDCPEQKVVETKDYESDIDKCYFERFQGNPQEWTQKVVIYKEDKTDSKIFWGFIIKVIEENKPWSVRYECEYAGRKSTHEGQVAEMDWKLELFNEWMTIHSENLHKL